MARTLIGGAVGASALGHALVVSWTLRLEPPPRPPPPRTTVKVEVREAPRPPPPPAVVAEPARRSARPPRRKAVPTAPVPQESAPVVEAPPPEPAPAPVEPGPPPPPPVDLFSEKALKGGVSVPVTPAPLGRDGGFGMLPGEAAGIDAASDVARITARVAGASIDQNAKSRVQAGLVDPKYTRIGRAILDGWDPDRALPETSAELWVKRRAKNAEIGMKLWQEASANYAATGSPLAAGELLDQEPIDTRDRGNEVGLLDAKNLQRTYRNYQRGKFNEGRSARVLVEEEPGGKVRVSLVQSSGDMEVDRAAVEDIRRAVTALAATEGPPETLRRSVWSLQLKIIINPPVPMVGFTFDEVLETPKLELPLGRKLLKRVQLEAVYDDDPRLAEPNVAGPRLTRGAP